MRSRALILLPFALLGCTEPTSEPSGIAAKATLVGAPLAGTVASQINVVVKVTDTAGVAVARQLVNFVVTKGGGSVFAGSALSNDQGEAKEIWTLGTVAGEQRLEARAVNQTTGEPIVLGSFAATASAGPPVTFAKLLFHDLLVVLGERPSITPIITPAADAFGNPLPFNSATGDGISLKSDTVTATAAGLYPLRVVGYGLDEIVSVRVVEDLTKGSWLLTWRCAGATAGSIDSLRGSETSTKVEVLSTTRAGAVSLPIRLTVSGVRNNWRGGLGKPDTVANTEELTVTQSPDSLVFTSLGASILTRRAAGNYQHLDGRSRCGASTWKVGEMALLKTP